MDERSTILDANERHSFHTIVEAINYCTGTNYAGWMKACWPSVFPDSGLRMWFPKLSRKVNADYISEAFECVNYISDDWMEFVFDDYRSNVDDTSDPIIYRGYDLIFAKEIDGDYLFRGVFVRDDTKSSHRHHVSKRIATRVKLIGTPAHELELLDSVGTINDPLLPKRSWKETDGLIRCICGRCDHDFKLANRCPECGQLIDMRGVSL